MLERLRWCLPLAMAVSLAAALAISGCLDFEADNPVNARTAGPGDPGDDGDDGPIDEDPPPPGSISIQVTHVASGDPVGSSPAALNTTPAGDHYFSALVRYVLSEFRLVGSTTGRAVTPDYDSDAAHVVDAFQFDSDRVDLLDVPAGTYDRVEFRFGIAPGAAATVDASWDMEWDEGGYTYLRHEGLDFPSFGSVGVAMGPAAGNDYTFRVGLDLVPPLVVVEQGTAILESTFDLNAFYGAPNLLSFAGVDSLLAAGADTTLQRLLRENGSTDAWSIRP